jgi:trehalose 6-phosphate synthase
VLILSMLAGAAAELEQGALLVNPYDLDGVADAFARAAAMPLAERRERWAAMMQPIERNDIHAWCAGFMAALQAQPRARARGRAQA